jgi:ribosomal-protein-alanine N-acetyltransferase
MWDQRPPEEIRTKRLLLRRPRPADAQAIFEEYASDPQVTRYLGWEPNASVEETATFLEERTARWQTGTSFAWVLTRAGEDRPIGMIELRPQGHRAEVGYVLGRKYWNRGYMTEAVRAVVAWALAQPHVYRVWAVCDVENLASARVLEKAGMRREGVLRRWSVHPNLSPEPRDCLCYAIVR